MQDQDRQQPGAQALAVIQRGGTALQQLAEFQKQQFNILAPIDWSGQLPAGTRLSLRVEALDISSDTYSTEGGRRALLGHALDRVSAAAGVTFPESVRTDGRIHPHYVEFAVLAKIVDCDGVERFGRGTRAIDLRQDIGDGTPGADLQEILYSAEHSKPKRDPTKQIMKARQFIVPMCESKARNRATRHLISVKAGYTAAELAKPFVVAKLVVDTADPVAKEMVLSRLTGATQALYGRPADVSPGPAVDADYREAPAPDPAGRGEPAGESPAPGGSPSSPPPAAPPPEERLRAVYERYQAAGGTASRFQSLVQYETDLVEVQGINHAQVTKVEVAIARALAEAAQQGGAA